MTPDNNEVSKKRKSANLKDDECKHIMSSDDSDASDDTPKASGTSANLKDGDEFAELAEPTDIEFAENTDVDGKSEEHWHLEAEERRERINCLVRSIYLSSNDDRNNNNSGERDVFLEMKENDCLVKAIYAADIEFCKQHILSIPNYDKDYKEMKHKYRNAPLLARTSQPSKMMPDNNEVSKKRKYKGHKNYLENVRTKKHKKYSAYLRKCKQEIKEKMKQLRELEDKKYDSDSDEESVSNSDDNFFSDSDEGSD
jgi:hypothetical protein